MNYLFCMGLGPLGTSRADAPTRRLRVPGESDFFAARFIDLAEAERRSLSLILLVEEAMEFGLNTG